jgi:stress response protein YsnF
MHDQTLIAAYATRDEAERVRNRLIESGIPNDDIRPSPDGATDAEGPAQRTEGGNSFWDWLFGTDVPETDRAWYQSNLREGRTAVSVRSSDVTKPALIEGILEEYEPVSMGDDAIASGPGPANENEERIPIIKEELEVGKRETEQRYRIRAYTVEHPVEENVTLRDERVVIERRPISSEGAADDQALKPREVEIIERHEEPVVAKKAQATEEVVVVRKEVQEHTEAVRDKVRETKVEVDKNTTDDKPPSVPRERAIGEAAGESAKSSKSKI